MKTNKFKASLASFIQTLYITSNLYLQNSLNTAAAACAFGFLFSLLPTVFMIIIVLVRILHTEMSFIMQFYSYISAFIQEDQFEKLLNSALSVKSAGFLEIITTLGIFWLARKFFFSLTHSFQIIFHKRTTRKGLSFSLWAMLGEAVLVAGTAIIISVLVMAKTTLHSSFITTRFPWMTSDFYPKLVANIPLLLLFIITILTYRFAPGTQPRWRFCIISSLLTNTIFRIVQFIFSLFLNTSRYNLIYGVLSNLIVTLLEAGIFFQIFLFFAQYIYTIQFFSSLKLAQLYLLPPENAKNPFLKARRYLFLADDSFLQKENQIAEYEMGSTICKKNDVADCVYGIIEGSVEIDHNGQIQKLGKGAFFGESACLLDSITPYTVTALTKTRLLCIKKERFEELIEKNSDVSRKALSLVSSSFR